MYSLLSGLVKYVLKKDEYCVLIIGLDNAGKTTFLEQVKTSYCHNRAQFPLDKIVPTVGLNVGKIATQGVKITLWDMGGQDALRTLWKDYFLSCHGVVYIVDSEDEERLLDSRDVFLKVISHVQTNDLPLLVLANKRDSDHAEEMKKIKSIFKECADVIGQRDCVVLPCSALKGEGLEDGIEWLTLRMKNNDTRPSRENG
ncbi:ADP-ribosylation factor-related protein 1-like [Bolinopsis microptera]|uniref:ADP-ribosylation factor-related protein 1-like n=1 Tax=Bolinopsis microptera TaxID=2820187 RepID=UPI0030798DD3